MEKNLKNGRKDGDSGDLLFLMFMNRVVRRGEFILLIVNG